MKEDRKLWTDRIKDYRASGLTAVKWSEKNDVSVHKLRYYINKFNKEKKLESKQEFKEPNIEEITYKRRKSKGLNKKSFEDLPVELIEYLSAASL